MSALKTRYFCAELAAMKLPGFSATRQGWEDRVKQENWPHFDLKGRGRGGVKREYQLPQTLLSIIGERAVQTLLKTATVEQAEPDTAVVPAPSVKPSALKDWQRETAQARAAICAEVRRQAEASGTERAIRTVIELAVSGSLAPHLQRLVAVANAKVGADEVEHCLRDNAQMLEAIRDLSDLTEVLVILVGMEQVQAKIARHAQISSRIAKVVEFQPATIDDVALACRQLAEVEILPELVTEIHRQSAGRMREIMNAITICERTAKRNGIAKIGLQETLHSQLHALSKQLNALRHVLKNISSDMARGVFERLKKDKGDVNAVLDEIIRTNAIILPPAEKGKVH